MITISELGFAVWWIIFLLFLQISFYASLRNSLPKYALPVSFSGSILLYTLITWYLGYCGLPLWLVIPVFILMLLSGFREIQSLFTRDIPLYWRYYLLYFGIFACMLVLRMYSPDIGNAEKFMDHAVIASILNNPVIPPVDPWLSGYRLDVYYYLGYWMIGSLGLLAGIPSFILFNLSIPTIAALAAVNLYAIGDLLIKRLKVLPVIILFIVNPAFIYFYLTGTPAASVLWDSTRVITNTINEYPLFSFVFGDVHAHVIAIFNQIFLILLLVIGLSCWKELKRKGRIILCLLTALSLGTMPPVNSWDVLIYAPLLLVVGLCITAMCTGEEGIRRQTSAIISSAVGMIRRDRHYSGLSPCMSSLPSYLLGIPVIAILLYTPFYLQMKMQGVAGIGFVQTPTDPVLFLLVNGWFFIIFLFSIRSQVRKFPWVLLLLVPCLVTGYLSAGIAAVFLFYILMRRDGIPDILAASGFVILIVCEFVYLKDNMGGIYYRMNTVFKLYLAAWLLLGISSFSMAGLMIERWLQKRSDTLLVVNRGMACILVILLAIPVGITVSGGGSYTPTLNGISYLSQQHSGDSQAIQFLRGLPGKHTLVEAEGGDFGYFSRVSSLTGIPAVVGEPSHEFMWRGNNPVNWYATRLFDVKMIYEDPNSTVRLMKKYHADLLYVGPSEKERYNVVVRPDNNIREIYNKDGVQIFQCT